MVEQIRREFQAQAAWAGYFVCPLGEKTVATSSLPRPS
jgi:hypothetical protein